MTCYCLRAVLCGSLRVTGRRLATILVRRILRTGQLFALLHSFQEHGNSSEIDFLILAILFYKTGQCLAFNFIPFVVGFFYYIYCKLYNKSSLVLLEQISGHINN